jgi:bilin biosynthesis protein
VQGQMHCELAFGTSCGAIAPSLAPLGAARGLCRSSIHRAASARGSRMCAAAAAGDARGPSTPDAATVPDVDALLARLAHKNKNLRVKASAELARLTPADAIVARLLPLLLIEETDHRRAAVQALGMIGMPAVGPVLDQLARSENPTVRASCSKALAAVAMYFPQDRASFPDAALDALHRAVVDAPDPVTKLATVGCLTTLACDATLSAKPGDPEAKPVGASSKVSAVRVQGNERAVRMLTELLSSTDDVVLGVSIAGALAQIANCGSDDRKAVVLECLQHIAGRPVSDDDNSTGFTYVQEMCRSHIDQLQGKQA